METHETAHINRVTEIRKLLWQWIGLYPREFYRPASLLISTLPLEIPLQPGLQAGAGCTTESYRQAMRVDGSHAAQPLIKELYANLIMLNPVDS